MQRRGYGEYARIEDHGPSAYTAKTWWRLARVEGGRYLLVGADLYADTVRPDLRPVDLFADAPDWVPWDWLERVEARQLIGFAYWWDGQRWGRVSYPGRIRGDGMADLVARHSSPER